MTRTEWQILQSALRYVGAPYIWGGKGALLWSATKPIIHNFGRHVFDCSGLWTQAFFEAGLGDHRMMHSAQTLYSKLKPLPSAGVVYMEKSPCLGFFGPNGKAITHVAGFFMIYNNEFCLEAAGGGSTTTLPTKDACVMLRPPARTDFVDFRAFPQDRKDLE